MTQQATEVAPVVSSRGALGLFMWIWSGFQALAGWFYSVREEYPQDEAGEFMRRYMANKSWFDKISSGWSDQSFLSKAIYLSLFILSSSFVGLFLGSSSILAISAIIISSIAHKLLIAHEANRWQGARIFAAEAIALNANLRITQTLFSEVANEMQSTHAALHTDSEVLQEQVEALDAESQVVHLQNETLIAVVENVERETASLLTQQHAVHTEFEMLAEDLGAYQQAIQASREEVEQIERSVADFSDAVIEMQENQVKLAGAVDSICFFATQRPSVKTPDLTENDDFIAALLRDVEEHDAFVAELTNQSRSMIH